MKKSLVFLLVLLIPCLVYAQDNVQQLLEKGNAAYMAFDNQAALENFQKALELDPGNFEAAWKTARALTDVGKALGGDAEKEKYIAAGKVARKCIERHGNEAAAHFALAWAIDRLARFEGGKKKIKMAKEVEIEAKKALELNPQHDGAAHILGRWNYNIATLGWFLRAAAKIVYGGVPKGASLENAAKDFAMAIEINANKPVHRLEYGRTLLELGKKTEAEAQPEKFPSLENVQCEDETTTEEERARWKYT